MANKTNKKLKSKKSNNLGKLPVWDLSDLYKSTKDKKITSDLKFVKKAYKKFIKTRLPRGLMSNADEVLPMLLLLCSKHSSMMGGCLVPIDAGEGKTYQI